MEGRAETLSQPRAGRRAPELLMAMRLGAVPAPIRRVRAPGVRPDGRGGLGGRVDVVVPPDGLRNMENIGSRRCGMMLSVIWEGRESWISARARSGPGFSQGLQRLRVLDGLSGHRGEWTPAPAGVVAEDLERLVDSDV